MLEKLLNATGFVGAAFFWVAIAFPALAQQDGKNIETNQMVPSLMFFTLGAVLLVAIASFVYFLRKRSNREATERALGMDESRR